MEMDCKVHQVCEVELWRWTARYIRCVRWSYGDGLQGTSGV